MYSNPTIRWVLSTTGLILPKYFIERISILLISSVHNQETNYPKKNFDVNEENLKQAQMLCTLLGQQMNQNFHPTLDMLNIPMPVSVKNSKDMESLSQRSKSINTLKKSVTIKEQTIKSIYSNRKKGLYNWSSLHSESPSMRGKAKTHLQESRTKK